MNIVKAGMVKKFHVANIQNILIRGSWMSKSINIYSCEKNMGMFCNLTFV